MKRKVSGALAASLLVGQFQGVALAESSTNLDNTDLSDENVLDLSETSADQIDEEVVDSEENQEQLPDTSIQEETNVEEETSEDMVEDIPQENEDQKEEEASEIEEVLENQVDEPSVEVEDSQTDINTVSSYQSTGKLEVDLNFAMPIKYTTAEKTNMTIKLISQSKDNESINLGSDTTSGTLSNGVAYTLEALNSQREPLKDGETDVAFYHLTFENLELGEYSLEISGDGYQTAQIDNIDVTTSSKRVMLGTSDYTYMIDDKGTEDESDDIKEYYPGVFLAGNVDDNDAVTQSDYDALKEQIKASPSSTVKSSTQKYDLNRDGKIDITDLSYVHQNIGQSVEEAEILKTNVILDANNIEVKLPDTTVVDADVDVKDVLQDNGASVALKTKSDEIISEQNPVSMELKLSGELVEEITIKAPSENAPTSGTIVIPGAGENGGDLTVSFDESNIKQANPSARSEAQDEIVVNLGQQVAVSQITINVTGSRSNKNLTEIAQVEFLNNVYTELPKPNMNIPVINSFTSGTAVGNEHMVLGWNHETNVTGYELKVELLNEDGTVKSTNTYKTSQNSLRIEGINGYSVYRVSIQSVSGDWESGYKDEQEDYDATVTGSTNLINNANDKDGLPDNVDANYQPNGWDSVSGVLSSQGTGENASNFGADSIVELQVIPETAPEGPEGITITSEYQALKVSWKSHKKAKDYDLYYREVGGDGAWIKANDLNGDYVDTDPTNDIPDGVANLSPEEKSDQDELIRGTSYTITGLKENTMYEIKMTATNHHGTGGLSQTYLGTAKGIDIPIIPEYKLINRPGSEVITDVSYPRYNSNEHPNGVDKLAIVDGDYHTYWTAGTWNTGHDTGPIVTFDKEYTIDTIRIATRLDGVYAKGTVYDYVPVRYFDSEQNAMINVNATYTTLKDPNNGALYYEIKLPYPVTTNQIQTSLRINPSYGNAQYSSISEIKFYEYDSLEQDVDALFKDTLQLELADGVTQTDIDELVKRANTIDPVSMEYHPNQKDILEKLQRAQDLLDDVNLNDKILTLDSEIRNTGSKNTIGQSNNYQSLGVAVKPGDKVTIYISSPNKNTKFNLGISQYYGESGTAFQTYSQKLSVGKNEIVIPESAFTMDYEKGGNLYLSFDSNYNDNQLVQVRVSGGTEIPHLNLNNIISDASKEQEAKDAIRTYIRELKTYVNTLPDRYPTVADKTNNIYTYDPETSILNSTEIEGDRITLSLAADQVLQGITDGLSTEDQQVERLYNNLLAWEQLMQVSYVQQGLLESAIDVDGDGKITTTPQSALNGKSEQQYFKDNQAPLNRINIKYQRMFTGAFMYASGHHVGIGYNSIAGMMQGVPFTFDENGNLTNANDGQLFGWGISHEIGHVHDVNGLTYAEITNNILALITQTFNDIDASRIEGSYDQVYEKVTSGSEGLANGFTRLAMFWQLHLAYDNAHTYEMLDLNTDTDINNDTVYAKLYRATRDKGIAPAEKGYDQVAQTFIMRASDAVGKDLREFFQKWGVVASPNTNQYLDQQNYPKEDKAIYYLNDEARRLRLAALENGNLDSLIAADDTQVVASFGLDEDGNQITDRTYLNQKTVPLQLSVTKDNEKILGYEIIKVEATSEGLTEVPCGFVERNHDGEKTEYVDVIDVVNNRTFGYKVRAYDYNLNVTEETEIGTVKVSHDGSITKSNWTFETNTVGIDDVADEDTGHGSHEFGSINNIKDNDASTVYNAVKATTNTGQVMNGDPYITIEMDQIKSIVGLKYTPGTTQEKSSFFNLFNIFNRNSEQACDPISQYEVQVSEDGVNWTTAHSGTFDTTGTNTIYFNEAGNSDNSQLWAYNAKYVKLIAKGATSISIAELDILGPQGDNIEIGMDNNDQVYENGIGTLKSDYEYAPGQVIPAGSLLIMGEYKGDPAYNIPLVLNENNENYALKAQAILLANLPEDSELGEVAEGNWIYWITPEQLAEEGNVEGTKVKAELYRYNKLDENGNPVGQRLVSDTFLYDIDINNLPTIELNDYQTHSLTYSYDEIVEVDFEALAEVLENR